MAPRRASRSGLHRHARAFQVDRRATAEIVALAVGREMFLVRAPAELARLPSLADVRRHDQVLANSLRCLRGSATWVSRSAQWMTLTPSFIASLPHSSRVFGIFTSPETSRAIFTMPCLTQCEIRPGFAP